MKYSLTFSQVDGKDIKGSGETLLDALRSAVRPLKITGKMTLTATDGKRKATRNLTVPQAKRMFYPSAQLYLAKDLEGIMK
jgi:hypothetical protein